MGQKNGKQVFDNGSAEAKCLELLAAGDWEGSKWYELFSACAPTLQAKKQNVTVVLGPHQAAKFLTKLFKYLRLDGSSRQFVASMMARLDVKQKGELLWKDILALRNSLSEGGEQKQESKANVTKIQEPENYALKIVKFADVYSNYKKNYESIQTLLNKIPFSQKRQDQGLKEAFLAIFETLSALYELDQPKWNAIKQRTYISFVKKTETTNTSVTSGLAASVLSPGQTIGILNCGTGPLKFQFYKMDETKIARVLIDFTPPEEQELYISNVMDEAKRPALSQGMKKTLGYLLEKRPVRVVALVTGELRENWTKGDSEKREQLEKTLNAFFGDLGVEAWNSTLGETPCYFLPQNREGKFEDIACGNLIADVAPQHDVLISCGIGRGTCQWSNRQSIIGHGHGMNSPEQLVGAEVSLKNTVLNAFTSAHIDELDSLSIDMGLPVIALKSGCLLVLERSKELMTLLTKSEMTPTVRLPAFAKGQTMTCDVDGRLLQVQMEQLSVSGECIVRRNGRQLRAQLDAFWLSVREQSFNRPQGIATQKQISKLRHIHRTEAADAGYFGILESNPKHSLLYTSAPLLYKEQVVGTAYCVKAEDYRDITMHWEAILTQSPTVYTVELAPNALIPYDAVGPGGNVSLLLGGLTTALYVNVQSHDWIACFPEDCTLRFTSKTNLVTEFMATVERLTDDGFYWWRVSDRDIPSGIPGIDEGKFCWPSNSCTLTATPCVVYRYEPEANLLVFDEKEGWVDAHPIRCLGGNWHEIQTSTSITMQLNGFNHTWGVFSSKRAFERQVHNYRVFLSEQFKFVEDAITGRKLRTDAQLISLQMKHLDGETSPLSNVRSLVQHLVTPDKNPHVLILAVAGSGKTITSRQLMLFASQENVQTVPILIIVQRLANHIRKAPQKARELCSQSFVEFYLRKEVVKQTQRDFLLQALRMRQVIVVIDGIDEAADCRIDLLKWIFNQLGDIRTVITSRPEGIQEDQFSEFKNAGYTFLDLEELSPQQQRRVIELQLQDNEYYKNLLAFSAIRTAQDALYMTMDAADRMVVEQVKPLDKVKNNPNMRQRNINGELLRYRKGPTVSETLYNPNKTLLRELSQKLLLPEEKLWERITSVTDELYQVAELAEHSIRTWIESLCVKHGVRTDCLEFSKRLKDPVRVFEKAEDDYKGSFEDDVPPTACVVDIIRCRLVDDLKMMGTFVSSLMNDLPPWATVVRLKNKCNPRTLDAAHFRNFLINLMVRMCSSCGQLVGETCCGPVTSHIFEVQVHHTQIVNLGEAMHQHHYYEALRSMLREDAMRNQVDFVLDEQMTLFDRVGRVPVLLSMLVLVLGDNRCLPTNVFELYRLAIKTSIRSFATRALSGHSDSWEVAVYQLLQRVAYEAQRLKIAAITQEDLDNMKLPPESIKLWDQICGIGEATKGNNLTFSIVKVISQKELYRFAHLSLQEFLYMDYLKAKDDPPNFELLLNDEKFDNALRLGVSSPDIAPWLVGDITLRVNDVNARQLTLLIDLVQTGPAAVVVRFGRSIGFTISDAGVSMDVYQTENGGTAVDPEVLKSLKRTEGSLVVLERHLSVPILGCIVHSLTTMLDLTGLNLTDAGVDVLLQTAPLLRSLEWLDLGRNDISSKGVIAIASVLRENYQLKFVGLGQNAFGKDGVEAFADMLQVNHTLTKWHLSSRNVPLREVEDALSQIPRSDYFSGSWIRGNSSEDQKSSGVRSLEKKATKKKRSGKGKLVLVSGPKELLQEKIFQLADQLPQSSRVQHREHVLAFVLKNVIHLVDVMPHYGPPNFSPALTALCKQIQQMKVLDSKNAEIISRWWKYSCVQTMYFASQAHCFEFPPMSYLINDAQFIAQEGYIPTVKDLKISVIPDYECTLQDTAYFYVFEEK